MALKTQIEYKKQAILITLSSVFVSFLGIFVGLLARTLNTNESKGKYITSMMSETVTREDALKMFNLITGLFTYVLIISLIIILLGTINLFLCTWYLNPKNKTVVGKYLYAVSIVHLLSFRVIGSILLYRIAIKYIFPDLKK